ncbi:MAG TPA: DJ-1/PfpI family protein, partial [Rubrivivax sp.]|nr:DJ-1/PfpI family protein [Rubrivivax sp.]
GATIQANAALADCPAPDVVCVPDLQVSPNEPIDARFADELAWLRRCQSNGALITAACTGAMLLAGAGLLDGEDATTHWAYCDTMQRRHPRVRVRPQRSLVVSGEGQRLVMAGGGTSWMDPGAVPDRAAGEHRRGHACGQGVADRLAPRRPAALCARGPHAPV